MLVGAILLSPLGWSYYLCLAVVPVAAVALSGTMTRAGQCLLIAAVGLMCWPLLPAGLPPFQLGQPSSLATLLIANLGSYCVLAVWVALLPRRPVFDVPSNKNKLDIPDD